MSEYIQSAGDIFWEDCFLTNHKQKRLDMLGLVAVVNIYEDIFSYGVHGNVIIIDTHNIVNEFPIIGQEKLHLVYYTPHASSEKVDRVFKVVRITDHVMEGAKQAYKLDFVSLDAFFDVTYSENRAFKGNGEQIIKTALNNLWNWHQIYTTEPITKPIIDSSTPINTLNFVSPQWSTVECIRWVTKYSLNKNGVADYLFYDTLKGYRFKSLTADLYPQTQKDIFVYDQGANDGLDIAYQYRKVHNLSMPAKNDKMFEITNRAYGQTNYVFDMTTSSVDISTLLRDDVLNAPKLNTHPLTNNTDKDFKFAKDHNIMNVAVHHGVTTPSYIDQRDRALSSRSAYLLKLEQQKIDLQVWGRNWLVVGDVVRCFFGKYDQSKETVLSGDDLRMTGKWLITAIHHQLAVSQHRMVLQLVRDSSDEKYESP